MYEMRSHGFVTINDVTFPEAVTSYGVNDVAYGVERSVISLLTDAATEFTAHFVRRPLLGHKVRTYIEHLARAIFAARCY
jgi:hypothetical protein